MGSALYKLVESHFLNGEEKFHARVVHIETLYMEDIIDLMNYHGSTVTLADIHAVKEDMVNAITRSVLQGKRVVTPFGTYSLSIKGSFDSPEDTLDPERHEVLASVVPSSEMKAVVNNKVSLSKHRPGLRRPSPRTFKSFDKTGGETALSPGHTARIYGELLRFDPDDEQQGIFLLPTGNGSLLNNAEPVRVEEVTRSTPSEATFLVPPDLPPGDYILEVRAQVTKNSIRSGQLEQYLTVPAS